MRKSLLTLIIILMTSPLWGATYYVEPQGSLANDSNEEGAVAWAAATSSGSATSIQTAMGLI